MTHYICDPKLNIKCPKTRCNYTHTGPCFATSNREFSSNKFIDLDIPGMYELFEDRISNNTIC